MFQRRDVLKLALGSAAGTTGLMRAPSAAQDKPPEKKEPAPPAPAQTSPPGAPVAGSGIKLAAPVDFPAGTVVDMARDLAKKPFKAVSSDLPDPFKTLGWAQYYDIHLKDGARIWADESVGFVIEPRHRGWQFTNSIDLFLVSDGKAYKLAYETALFDFGKLKPSGKIGDIGFSGFGALVRKGKTELEEIASFQGANFFRGQAKGQIPGTLARALALKIGDPKGEETPIFRSIWIEKPGPASPTLVVHALVDSESITGAFRFTIRPGDATIIDTECTLFPRTTIDNYGLAAMSATHLLGFMDHKRFDDYRPNVSEACGLQILNGYGTWIWRPVTNREALQVSSFEDKDPKGFGCLIRDRDFENYVDEDSHWEQRPSLWIETLGGNWGEGVVQLIEIPSQADFNDNILVFWRPKAPLKAGMEVSYAYRQFWCWSPPQKPDLAVATHSRSGSVNGKRQRFFVEFTGDIIGDPKRVSGVSPTLTAATGSITMMRTFPDPAQKAYRVLFELDPSGADSSELRLLLQADGKPVSETWLFRWTPL